MGAVIMMMLMSILEAPGLVWMDAVEAADGAMEINSAGVYTVWVWMKDDQQATAVLGGHKLEVAAMSDPEGRYRWAKAGELDLNPGKLDVTLGDTIASIAVSTDPEFDPGQAIGHMRVYDRPRAVDDRRVETIRDTDTVFTMPEFATREEWEELAARLRRRILVSSGLWPLPERSPLNAVVSEVERHEDYIIETVHLEAHPGFLVTGNLYRPVGDGPFPGLVSPHGHWKNGRLENSDVGSVPGRCITFARMGVVIFSYDMEGYVDSLQFEKHKWESQQEKLWGVHPFALQLWSSIRAVDFLESLSYVDKNRLGCTGASGGGTQTFALVAVDPRIKVAAPVNMISSNMQGGCVCENAPIIRLENSNMEIGALMAPRPLLMVAATGDWTVDTPRVEYPAIRSIYRLYNAEDRIESVQIDAGHNFNRDSREAVYRFFGKWLLKKGKKYEDFREPAFTVEPDELRVFPDDRLPQGYPSSEEIVAQLIDRTQAKWQSILPEKPRQQEQFRDDYGVALADALGASIPHANELNPEQASVDRGDVHIVERWIIRHPATGAAIPALLYRANSADRQDTVLIVHGKGKAALANPAQAGPGALVQALIDDGKAVMAIDPFLTGEHHAPQARTVRQIGRYPDTFLPTDTGYRVQDILTALSYLRSRRDLSGVIDLIGLDDAGIWCLFASALDSTVGTTVVDANQFDNRDDQAWVEKHYVSCIRSIGDLTTAAMLIAPRSLAVVNTGDAFDATGIRNAWAVAGAETLTVTRGSPEPAGLAPMLR